MKHRISRRQLVSQPTYFTGGEGKGYGTMPEMGEVLHLHFPVSDEAEHYIISSEGSDYEAISRRIHSSTLTGASQAEAFRGWNGSAKNSESGENALRRDDIQKQAMVHAGNQSLLLDDHQVKLHAVGELRSLPAGRQRDSGQQRGEHGFVGQKCTNQPRCCRSGTNHSERGCQCYSIH